MMRVPDEVPRQKIPKDGLGPRGVPDCYYTSRVLNSTFRYVRFVKKLRQEEEEARKGLANTMKELKDKQRNDFFIRCDRRSLINNVARRVDLCMAAYEQDLNKKRKALKDLLSLEEEDYIRKFVEQAQAGAELIWQEKKDRLKFLLEKRRKEHEEKFKDTPLSKCVHVLPCIYKFRAKETEEIQLYQIKEKEARKMAEKEFDKMWYEVAMKESDALAARMEQDAIDRLRRDLECKTYSDYQLEQRKKQREREREMLKEEAKRFRSMWEEDNRKEDDAERMRTEKRHRIAAECNQVILDTRARQAKKAEEVKLIGNTWDSLATQGLAEEKAKIEKWRQKERELVECNRRLVQLQHELAAREDEGKLMFDAEVQRLLDKNDKQRCEYKIRSQNTNRECRQGMIDQIKEREKSREDLKKRMAEEVKYSEDLRKQLEELVKYKARMEAEARKQHQRNILQQIEYNKLLKERALKEEKEQMQKCIIAAEEYQNEIAKMMSRPFFSEEVHPFMKQMAKGLRMQETCPCSKPNYCK